MKHVVSILLIATSAIALDCYSKNKDFWEDDDMRKNSRNFIIFMIVFGILGIIGSAVSFASRMLKRMNVRTVTGKRKRNINNQKPSKRAKMN